MGGGGRDDGEPPHTTPSLVGSIVISFTDPARSAGWALASWVLALGGRCWLSRIQTRTSRYCSSTQIRHCFSEVHRAIGRTAPRPL